MPLVKPLAVALLGLLLINPAFALDIAEPKFSICQYKGPDDPGCGGRPPPCCVKHGGETGTTPRCRSQYGD